VEKNSEKGIDHIVEFHFVESIDHFIESQISVRLGKVDRLGYAKLG